jgi:hypothetical protein
VLAYPLAESSRAAATIVLQPQTSLTPVTTTRPPVQYGKATYARTIYTVVALLCMFLLASLLGMTG